MYHTQENIQSQEFSHGQKEFEPRRHKLSYELFTGKEGVQQEIQWIVCHWGNTRVSLHDMFSDEG